MKFFLFTLFIAAAVYSAEAGLREDFDDIGKLVPMDKMKAVVAKHMMLNKKFQDFIKFVKTSEFSGVWDQLLSAKEFRDVVTYVQGSGYDLVEGINKIAALLKVNPYPQLKSDEIIIMPRTVNSFLRDILSNLPKTEISALMKSKMTSSPEWKKFITHLSQPKFEELIEISMKAQSTAEVRRVLELKGCELKKIIAGGLEILKWSQ